MQIKPLSYVAPQTEADRFTFQGKELQEDFDLNWYDFEWRNYDAVIWRTPSIDPHTENYYSLSPYSFLGNNPLLMIDPDGRDITIYYRDENNKEHHITINRNTDVSKLPKNQFIAAFLDAWSYLKTKDGKDIISQLVNDDSKKVFLRKDNNNNHRKGWIDWNPEKGLLITNGNVFPPALGLEHEMDHALSYKTNPEHFNTRRSQSDNQYENREERRVITGSETQTAERLKLLKNGTKVSRPDHDGTPVIVKGGVRSVNIDRPKTYNYLKNLAENDPYANRSEYKRRMEKFKD
jgi:RHS repeat-associated protein